MAKGGINLRLPAWSEEMKERNQCVWMRGFRYQNDFVESIPGTKKYHGASLGSRITALMPYYNDQDDKFFLLCASGESVYRRNESTNEFDTLVSGLTPNSIHGSTIRHGVMYIPSVSDGLKKYEGGLMIYPVGGGSTAPGNFRQILWAKEVDRLFGISDDAIFGQISWCDLGEPEIWDGANVERIKLKDGERVEGAELLYGKLIIFCTYSVWIYYIQGNEEKWRLEEAPTVVGCVAPNTIKRVGSKIWYMGESPKHQLGVYSFNGSISELLTDDVSPLFDSINPNKKRTACAEVHDDLYTVSFATEFSDYNNISIDLDLLNAKKDGTPAIYGPHTLAFGCSCVLNGRQNDKEFLMGDEQDGFVYVEGGTTLKGVNGDDGELLPLKYLGLVHADDFGIMKQYNAISINFRPRGYFDALVKYYLSAGSYGVEHSFNPQANDLNFAGDFNVYEQPFYGTPERYEYQEYLEMTARGTSFQLEISNLIKGKRLAFDSYDYEKKDLYRARKVQNYA